VDLDENVENIYRRNFPGTTSKYYKKNIFPFLDSIERDFPHV
jgi:hypothetical protein